MAARTSAVRTTYATTFIAREVGIVVRPLVRGHSMADAYCLLPAPGAHGKNATGQGDSVFGGRDPFRELYYDGGGERSIADEAQRAAALRAVWEPRQAMLSGLSEIGLAYEFDYMIIGRSLADVSAYLGLPRTGRGTPLARAARGYTVPQRPRRP